jgi:hypothetical protein
MEKDICEVQQYERRNNVKITQVFLNLSNKNELESKVIELAKCKRCKDCTIED